MTGKEKIIEGKKDVIILPLMMIGVMVSGVLLLFVLQKLSVRNQRICSYLGGLWVPDKNIQGQYRCYTYEEFYK